jgi:hypothetical protein
MPIGSICDAAQQNLKECSLLVSGTKKNHCFESFLGEKKNDTIHLELFG